jgi:hypothetical protein
MAHEPFIKLHDEHIIAHKGVVGEVFATMGLRAVQLGEKLWPLGKVLD